MGRPFCVKLGWGNHALRQKFSDPAAIVTGLFLFSATWLLFCARFFR